MQISAPIAANQNTACTEGHGSSLQLPVPTSEHDVRELVSVLHDKYLKSIFGSVTF